MIDRSRIRPMNRVILGGLCAALFLGPAIAATPPPQIAVSPSKFELVIGDRPTNDSLTLMNLGDEAVTIDVSTATWDLDENSEIRIVEPNEQSLDQWMVINPLQFTIPSGESQTVRFSIRPRVEPEAGEHRAMIYFDQRLAEVDSTQSQVRVKFRLGVAVYGMAGEIERSGRLHGVEVANLSDAAHARFDITSSGSAHVRLQGQYAVYAAEDYPGVEVTQMLDDDQLEGDNRPPQVLASGYMPTRPVLAGTRRYVSLPHPLPLPPGDYVLDLNGELAGGAIDLAVPFQISSSDLVAEAEPVLP